MYYEDMEKAIEKAPIKVRIAFMTLGCLKIVGEPVKEKDILKIFMCANNATGTWLYCKNEECENLQIKIPGAGKLVFCHSDEIECYLPRIRLAERDEARVLEEWWKIEEVLGEVLDDKLKAYRADFVARRGCPELFKSLLGSKDRIGWIHDYSQRGDLCLRLEKIE